jgi:3-oxoacyl-[acyl-carrier protein] reductase
MDLELNGKRAVITGGTRGLGRAIAARLTAEGVAVSLCARDGDAVGATVRALGAVHAEAVDAADPAALDAYVEHAAGALGGLDLVVANVGGGPGGQRLEETTAEDWQATLALNVVHSAELARVATPHLRAAGGGAILMIASISGLRPQPRAQYAAAKAAVIHLAASLGRELGPDRIRVNSLSPGSILFEGGSWARRRDDDPESFAAFAGSEFPFGRLGSAEEVADVAAFLLSARASWINGTDVVVDGGQNAPGMGGY